MLYLDICEKAQIGFQEEASINMIGIRDLHDSIMYYIIIIVSIVTYILIKLMLDMNSNFKSLVNKYLTHSTLVEVIWTFLPALILVFIAIPTFKLLYSLDELLKPLLTLKVIGNQWFWNYSISDFDGININFDSYLIPESDLLLGQLRLLDVDNRVYLPILTPIRIITTSDDVIHSFAIPSLGIKIDAIPGRLNQSSLFLLREGTFFGQCSELCGIQHAYMPIVIEGVSNTKFFAWLFSFSSISFNDFINVLSSLSFYL